MAQQDLHTLTQTIEHLTPAEKLMLIEHLARSLRDVPTRMTPAQQREALHHLRQELATLPVHNPVDGFSNR
ncbi:MAG TPA: hypothetical protein VLQ80_33310, partial [Candidatus Saccharimonadia bacterium]|nr:hypothetical protein [Candidatus Saccharimonadia bacterium]